MQDEKIAYGSVIYCVDDAGEWRYTRTVISLRATPGDTDDALLERAQHLTRPGDEIEVIRQDHRITQIYIRRS
jgi:hypothetical protein